MERGFTLIELMMAILVAGVLLVVAVPSFRNVTANRALHNTAADLVTAIHTARAQAVHLHDNVTLESRGGAWENGWLIQYSATSVEQDQTFAPAGGVTVEETSGIDRLDFDPSGLVSSQATFRICDGRSGETGQEIEISRFGAVAVSALTCG